MCNRAARPCRSGSTTGPGTSLAPTSFSSSRPSSSPTHLLRLSCLRLALLMGRALRRLVFIEPQSSHLHIYGGVCIPQLGSVLRAAILRTKGYDVRVYIEDIRPVDMDEVLSADLVAISAITSTAPQSYRLADQVRAAGAIAVIGGTHTSFLPDEGLEHADFVVRGEGEFAFQELVDAIQAGQ